MVSIYSPLKYLRLFVIVLAFSRYGPVAQWLEHNAYNVGVGGSIPPRPTIMSEQTYKVEENSAGSRLDVFLADKTSFSRAKTQKLIKTEKVLINGKSIKKASHAVHENDTVSFDLQNDDIVQEEEKEATLHPSTKPLKMIKEEEDYLIVEKPAGLLVHPTQANEEDTLAGRIINAYPEIKGVGEGSVRPGIVHRIDRDASGLLVIAKNQEMFDHIKAQFKTRTVKKEYDVLVYGHMERPEGTIDFDIDRGKDGRMVSRPKIELNLKNVGKVQDGKQAITDYKVEKEFARYSMIKAKIHTGRMHQIRVHMFAFNHPVVGDTLYENKKLIKKGDKKLKRLFLHASKLCFEDLSGKEVCFESKLPNNLESYLENIK